MRSGRPARAGRPEPLELDLGIVAHFRGGAGDGGDGHLGEGDGGIGAVPEFAILGGDGDQANGRIVLVLPPGLVPVGPEFGDLGAVIAELGRAGDDHIFVAAAIDPGERDGGEALDLSVLVAFHIDQEVDGIFFAEDASGERPAALVLPVPGGEHADVDLLGQFPDPIGHFGRGLLIVVGMFLGHVWAPCCGQG